MDDPHDLERFVRAQQPIYRQARDELRAGRKRSHWMWFVFPQIVGLGHSPMARLYAISSLAEARSYLDHPLLGHRLREMTAILQALPVADAESVFGGIDAVKLRSSLTLFAYADDSNSCFGQALRRWFPEGEDAVTVAQLRGTSPPTAR